MFYIIKQSNFKWFFYIKRKRHNQTAAAEHEINRFMPSYVICIKNEKKRVMMALKNVF